jgi:hypothetical protein
MNKRHDLHLIAKRAMVSQLCRVRTRASTGRREESKEAAHAKRSYDPRYSKRTLFILKGAVTSFCYNDSETVSEFTSADLLPGNSNN